MKTKYTIFYNRGRIICQRKSLEDSSIEYITSLREFTRICREFIDEGYKITVKNNDVLLTKEGSCILIKSYDVMKHDPQLFNLIRNIELTVKRDGYIDITKKDKLSKNINRKKSKAVELVAVGAMLTVVIAGTVIYMVKPKTKDLKNYNNISATSFSATSFFEEKQDELYMVVDNAISSSSVTLESTPIANFSPQIEFEECSQENDPINAREKYYAICKECEQLYGIDAEILIGILTEESRGVYSSEVRNGNIGLMQLRYSVWCNKTVGYYEFNSETGVYEHKSMTITDEMLKDERMSIHIGAIVNQIHLLYYDYNLPMALQGYNMGVGTMENVLFPYLRVTGKKLADLKSDPEDLGWLPYRGKNRYIEHVLRWTTSQTFELVNYETGEKITYDFVNTLNLEPEKSKTF